MKKYLIVLICCLLLMGCSSQTEAPVSSLDESVMSNQSDFFWQIEVLHSELTDNLFNTQSFIQYDGAVENIDYNATPSDGNLFLLIELSIEKASAGGEPFSWDDVAIADSEGNEYRRMENDIFLEDYNLPRLKGTDLTIGGSSGFICVEVPNKLSLEDLIFIHHTSNGDNNIQL